MALTVGTDSYVTIAEADDYLQQTRISTDPALVAWLALSDPNKEIYLRNATFSIERLKFPGRKNDPDQALSFPRDIAGVWPPRRNPGYDHYSYYRDQDRQHLYNVYNPFSSNIWFANENVPNAIGKAETEEALELFNATSDTTIWEAARGALKSFNISGALSETYRDGPARGQSSPQTVLRSITAQELVAIFLGGSYRVI